MKWQVGLTTVPARATTTLPRTLASLAAAGFDKPVIFADADNFPNLGYPTVTRPQGNVGAFGHWLLSMWELFLRDNSADMYAIFQDDVLAVRNIRQYLESIQYPKNGYLNLYQAHNQAKAPGIGFYPSNQRGLGALGLVFSREAVEALLSSPHFATRVRVRTEKGMRGDDSLDGAVVDAMKKVGWKEFVHGPSLLQHQESPSSVGHNRFPLAPTFPGEEFDALTIKQTVRVPAQSTYVADLQRWGGSAKWAIGQKLFDFLASNMMVRYSGEDGKERETHTLELGCGLSTLAFDRIGTVHTAIENDPEALERVRKLLRPDTKVKLVYAPLKDGWYDWKPDTDERFDFVLVDGPSGRIGRNLATEKIPPMLAPRGVVVIDDTQRKAERIVSKTLSEKLGLKLQRIDAGDRKFDMLAPPPEPLGEGVGKEFYEWAKSVPELPKGCSACLNLARKMNEWGVEGCRQNMTYIVEDMLPRAREMWPKFKAMGKKQKAAFCLRVGINMKTAIAAARGDGDGTLRAALERQVKRAIRRVETNRPFVASQSASG